MKNNLTTMYIVRHGETEWNTKGLMQGHQDSPLTKNGEDQALQITEELKKIEFDLIFSSDLLRAKRTAEIIAVEKKLAVETTKLLRERYFAEYEGKPYHALKAFNNVFESLTEEKKFKYKEGSIESDEDITTRFITFLRETAITHPGKNILAVTHGGNMRSFLIKIGFGTYKNLNHDAISNTAYIKLLTDGIDFFVKETKGIEIKN